MANVVRDPRQHPDAIIPDLSRSDPLVTFSKDDIAFVYGSRWKQRYFTKIGDDFFPEPAQWDVTHKTWKRYFVPNKGDWWAPLYPPDNFKRPTGPLCDGCHSVNCDITNKTVTEWNVGCERCHGPGNDFVVREARNALCLGCHGPNAQNGPHAATIEQHTHHAVGSAGSECIACHMPKIAETLGDVKVRSHTFRFIWPEQTDTLNIPNACNLCHTDQTTAWATKALRSWADRSPWRSQ
jgi:predicted CXXCH cytochrome family protein